MKNRKPITPFAPHEIRQFVLPLTLSSIILMLGLAGERILNDPSASRYLIAYGILGTAYILINNIVLVRTSNLRELYGWTNSILSGIGLGLLFLYLPANLREVAHMLIIFGALAIVTISGRYHAYVVLLATAAISLPRYLPELVNIEKLLEYFMPFMVSIIALETIVRIKDTTQKHIHHLETINNFSRQAMQVLDTEKTISLLDTTIRDALEADTYYIGILKDDEIHLNLFFDEGEYFNGTRIPVKGTLSGWIIKNQKELFLPSISDSFQLEDVNLFIIGKEKSSRSWIGVPLKAANVTGVMVLASYQVNAFDRADLELLSSLAQHVTLSLDNTIRHTQLEEQTRLDSLTGVYNHGYFLKRLAEQSANALNANTSLSLIMLDIDHFKQYNDTYGHLVGDHILNSLCSAIKQHIKHKDAVGRWGGEEFVISLPGASGEQATQIAKRINETMANLRVRDREQRTMPVPTVSQGIAVFPTEADEIFHLIDLADRRLYIAKARGRNQIEPAVDHWEQLETSVN